jgi:hypothetical protein
MNAAEARFGLAARSEAADDNCHLSGWQSRAFVQHAIGHEDRTGRETHQNKRPDPQDA